MKLGGYAERHIQHPHREGVAQNTKIQKIEYSTYYEGEYFLWIIGDMENVCTLCITSHKGSTDPIRLDITPMMSFLLTISQTQHTCGNLP